MHKRFGVIVMCLNFEHLKNYPFGTNGKLIILGVPIHMHISCNFGLIQKVINVQ